MPNEDVVYDYRAAYGYCPICGSRGLIRERRPYGNDTCENRHTYPSRNALKTPDNPGRMFKALAQVALSMYGHHQADPIGIFDLLVDRGMIDNEMARDLRVQIIDEWRKVQSEYPWTFTEGR